MITRGLGQASTPKLPNLSERDRLGGISGKAKATGIVCVLLAIALTAAYIFHGTFAVYGVLLIAVTIAMLALVFFFIQLFGD